MKGFAIFAFLLAGCSNPGIVQLAPDTYMLSRVDKGGIFGNEAALKVNVIKDANAFAQSKGKVALEVSSYLDPMRIGHFASFEYKFRLADANELKANSTQSVSLECKEKLQTSELDQIREKVELFRDSFESPVPFTIATIDTFPTEQEKLAIAKWATLREECVKSLNAANSIPPSSTPLQVTQIQQDRSFGVTAAAKVGDLIVALYQQKLTYGEFASKRYEISRDAAEAERQYRHSELLADQQQRMQAQQLAQQQYANNLAVWSTYMQSLSARQPQTVHVDGTIRVQQ